MNKLKNRSSNGLIFILVAIMALCAICVSFNTKSVMAQQTLPLSYYETTTKKAVFENTLNVSSASSLSITEVNVPLSASNVEITSSTITLKNLPSTTEFAEGLTYNLELNSGGTTYILPFMYVTKIIRTAEDCKVFDIKTPSTNVYGYYVLANDIDLGSEVFNKHDGLFDLTDPNDPDDRGPATTGGFWGTFNGLGHNVTFTANRAGFFGRLLGNATVINTGFTNVKFKNTAPFPSHTENSMPILAHYFYSSSSLGYGLIKDCFFHTDTDLFGGIIYHGSYLNYLKIENILIDVGELKSYTDPVGLGLGIFIAHHGYTFFRQEFDYIFNNIYVVSGSPLGLYASSSTAPEGHVAYDPNTGKFQNGFVKTYASNRGITQDLSKGIVVYKNVKQYLNYNDLSADSTNNFSSFNSKYWTSANNRLKWKNLTSTYFIDFTTQSSSTSDNINFFNATDKVVFFLSADGLKIEDATLSATMLSEYEVYNSTTQTTTTYHYPTDVVEIKNNNTNEIQVTPVKEGTGRILITCDYNGTKFEKTIKLSVKTNSSVAPPPDVSTGGNGDTSSSCASVTNTSKNNDIYISCLFLGAVAIYRLFRKKTVR